MKRYLLDAIGVVKIIFVFLTASALEIFNVLTS